MIEYTKKINQRRKQLSEQRQKWGKPNTDKEALRLAISLSVEAEFMIKSINSMVVEGLLDPNSSIVNDEFEYWALKTFSTLGYVKHSVTKVSPAEYESVLVELQEWDYLLNYIKDYE